MPKAISTIALLTDFGVDSWYVGAMKGAILTIDPELTVVDISHSVPSHRIGDGSFILATTYGYFPPGTVFVAVIDPTVGSTRKGLVARAGEHFFVAPDNGLLTEVFLRETDREVRYIEESRFWRPERSDLFHGRDIFAPVAAHLAGGEPITSFGPSCTEPVELVLPEPLWDGEERLRAEIILVDSFGNLISDLSAERLRRYLSDLNLPDEDLRLRIGEFRLRGLNRSYSDGHLGEVMALIGSSGYLEIAVNRGRAQRVLQSGAGDPLWIYPAGEKG